MNKLPLSIGILSWHSGQTLIDTLHSYYINGLFDLVNDVTILFQEVTDEDKQIADHFSIPYIGLDENIGIGKGFTQLTENTQTDNILLLEHDWLLIESTETTYNRLTSGLELINDGFQTVRYRHRAHPGFPLFTEGVYKGNELNHYDPGMDLVSPHLLDSIHWLENPEELFSDKIQKQNDYFVTTSRWGNWTNNPCLFKKQFYLDTVTQFAGGGIDLEGKISGWWARQDYKVAHGEGLFMHKDIKKFGR
jgi:hypothetical protein